jgi:hypothetical protein
MPITERPVSFNSADIEDTNIKPVVFSYDFPEVDPAYNETNGSYDLKHRDVVEDIMNIKGVAFFNILSKESNVSFEGTNYKLLNLIFTKGMDNTNGNSSNPDYEYAFVLKLQGVSSSKYMYIFIPIEDSVNEGPENMVEFLRYIPKNKLEDSKKKRPKLQLNALIPSTSTYYYYEYKNNLVLFFDTSTISLNMNGGGILTASKWGSNVQNKSVHIKNIYQGTSLVNQSIMSYADMGEIYIDCQPVDGGENEIIKPRNVYKMTPLFDTENLSKSSGNMLSLFFSIVVFTITIKSLRVISELISGKISFKTPSSDPKLVVFFIFILSLFIFHFYVALQQLSIAIHTTKENEKKERKNFKFWKFLGLVISLLELIFPIYYFARSSNSFHDNFDLGENIMFKDKPFLLTFIVECILFGLLFGFALLLSALFITRDIDHQYVEDIAVFSILSLPIVCGIVGYLNRKIQDNNA